MKQFLVIVAAYGLGYAVSEGFGLPLPANVLGLLFLFAALCLKWVKLSDVEGVADFIVSHLALFFLPPTVGIMLYFDLLKSSFVQIFVPLLIAVAVGFFVTGQVTQLVIRFMAARRLSRATGGAEAVPGIGAGSVDEGKNAVPAEIPEKEGEGK